MRVAYVCLDPGVPVFGRKGSSVHCQEVIRAMRNRGFDVEIFATRFGEDVPHDLATIRTHKLRRDKDLNSDDREKTLIGLNPQIQKLLAHAAPFDLIYERYALWSFAAMKFAHQNRIPGVLEVNSPLIDEQKTYRTLRDESAAKQIRGQCFRYASSLIAVSEQVAQQIRQNYFAMLKTTVIPNGVNCQKFQPPLNDLLTPETAAKVIGFVGTLKPWHGVSILLDAFAIARSKNPNLVLKIVGDGPQREQLQNQLLQYSDDVREGVKWLGAIPNSLMPKVLASFDIAVAPYPELDNFYFSPLKILEYMAAGLPIVASRIGQIPDLIDDGISGLLVRPGCPNELANAILQLCDDHEKQRELGCAARRHVVDNHTWEKVVDRILTTVSELPDNLQCGVG